MLLKLLIILFLFYLVGKSISNLMRAVRADSTERPRMHTPPDRPQRVPWEGPSPGRTDSSERDVEDAKWVDL